MARFNPWFVLLLCSCVSTKFKPENLACDSSGSCIAGYVCHPGTKLCVQAVVIACASGGVCPSELRTGMRCDAVGSFVPCANDGGDCSRGCRTCGVDQTWSKCSAPTAPLRACGEETCNGLDDDCNGKVDDLTEIGVASLCQQSTGGLAVDLWACVDGACVVSECRTGFTDFDRVADNGCEAVCTPSNGGVETCDGLDNDCDGMVDETGAVGCVTLFIDRDHDGLGGGEGECRCAEAASRPYSATVGGDCNDDNATCRSDCADDDEDGVCVTDDCSDGIALCAAECTTPACAVSP